MHVQPARPFVLQQAWLGRQEAAPGVTLVAAQPLGFTTPRYVLIGFPRVFAPATATSITDPLGTCAVPGQSHEQPAVLAEVSGPSVLGVGHQ